LSQLSKEVIMTKILFHCEHYQSVALNAALLVLRLFFGLTMAFAHGLKKIPPAPGFVGYMNKLSLPLPELMAWCAGLSEFAGGILIALGLATRISSASWIVTMGVAALVAHGADPFQKKELALSYMVVGLFLFLTGGGKFSVDGLITKK
jgi:putative oxidoreductase